MTGLRRRVAPGIEAPMFPAFAWSHRSSGGVHLTPDPGLLPSVGVR